MVEVRVHIEGVVFLEHPAELRGHALWQHAGHLGPETDDLHMGDFTEAGEDPVQFFIAQGQGDGLTGSSLRQFTVSGDDGRYP